MVQLNNFLQLIQELDIINIKTICARQHHMLNPTLEVQATEDLIMYRPKFETE